MYSSGSFLDECISDWEIVASMVQSKHAVLVQILKQVYFLVLNMAYLSPKSPDSRMPINNGLKIYVEGIQN